MGMGQIPSDDEDAVLGRKDEDRSLGKLIESGQAPARTRATATSALSMLPAVQSTTRNTHSQQFDGQLDTLFANPVQSQLRAGRPSSHQSSRILLW